MPRTVYEDEDAPIEDEQPETKPVSILPPTVTHRKKKKKKEKRILPTAFEDEKPETGLATSSVADVDPVSEAEVSENEAEKARMEQLENIRIFLMTYNGNVRLREYMSRNVMTGKHPNPWLAKPLSESSMRKHLRRYIKCFMIKALAENGLENKVDPSALNCTKSRDVIQKLNKELVSSLLTAGAFPSATVNCAINNCKKFWISPEAADIMLPMESKGKFNRCLVDDCVFKPSATRIRYICLEGGAYSDKLEVPQGPEAEKPPKMVCFCTNHVAFFELMYTLIHMDWNVYQNCLHVVKQLLEANESRVFDELLDAVPKTVYKGIMLHYMSRYHILFAFGEPEDWQRRGFTLSKLYYFGTGREMDDTTLKKAVEEE